MFKQILTFLYSTHNKRQSIFLESWKLKYVEQQLYWCILFLNDENLGNYENDLHMFDENIGDDYYFGY